MKPRNQFCLTALVLAMLASPLRVQAHCDSLDGPVIVTAREALTKGDVTPVLKWVKADDEAAIRDAFAQSLEVRKLSPAAAALADRHFFETLVRLHRAGEGEPFTGLLPAGSADPALVAADQAIARGSAEALAGELAGRLQALLKTRFQEVLERKAHMNDSVAAGREYTEAYVVFIHLYERLATETDAAPAKHGAHPH